jgi:hypothetical protein
VQQAQPFGVRRADVQTWSYVIRFPHLEYYLNGYKQFFLMNMKVGINNIFIILWFILILTCGSAFWYWAAFMDFFGSDIPILAKFFVGLLMLITLGVLIFMLIKFRILIIHRNKIRSYYPFLLKYNEVDISLIKQIQWTSTLLKVTLYKHVTLRTENGKSMSLSDFEFENFDMLISKIPNSDTIKKREFEKYQAENEMFNMWFMIVSVFCLLLIVLFLNFGKNIYHWIHLVFYFVGFILIFTSVRRIKKYNKTIKNYR